MSEKQETFPVCPKCLSKDVHWDLSTESIAGGRVFNQKKCRTCGFTSLLFPELTEKEYLELEEKQGEK